MRAAPLSRRSVGCFQRCPQTRRRRVTDWCQWLLGEPDREGADRTAPPEADQLQAPPASQERSGRQIPPHRVARSERTASHATKRTVRIHAATEATWGGETGDSGRRKFDEKRECHEVERDGVVDGCAGTSRGPVSAGRSRHGMPSQAEDGDAGDGNEPGPGRRSSEGCRCRRHGVRAALPDRRTIRQRIGKRPARRPLRSGSWR